VIIDESNKNQKARERGERKRRERQKKVATM
jgi:hypothetical protein